MHPTRICPVVRPGINDQFFCKSPDGSVYVEKLVIGTGQPGFNVCFDTGYLQTNVLIDLLGISYLQELADCNRISNTDFIDPQVRLKSLAIGKLGGVILSTLDIVNDSSSYFSFSPQGNSCVMRLNFQSLLEMPDGSQKVVSLLGELTLDVANVIITADQRSGEEIGVIGYQLEAYRSTSNCS